MLKSQILSGILFGFLFLSSFLRSLGQEIIVNEYYNAASQSDEWTELVVVKDNLDISGWFLGDNNAGTSTWQPKLQFSNHPLWKNLRSGTIIIIDHASSDDNCDDITDADKSDGFIRVCCRNQNYFSGGSSNTMFLSDQADFVQIVNSTGKMIHGIGHASNPGSSVLGGSCFTTSANWTNTTTARAATRPCGNFTFFKFGMLAPTSLIMTSGTTSDFSSGIQSLTNNSIIDTSDSPFEGIGNSPLNNNWIINLRAPKFDNQIACANQTSNGIVHLNWQPVADSFPADLTIGYMVVRNQTGVFGFPENGVEYPLNSSYGSGNQVVTVVGIINSSQITTFNDNPGSGTFYYRVFPFRFKNTIGFVHPTRGRAYNQTNFISLQNQYISPDAGVDKIVCSSVTSLEGLPPQLGTGIWTLVSGSGSLGNSSSSQSTVSNLGIGANTFSWSITVGVCSSADQVVIFREGNPVNLGPDSTLCVGSVYNLKVGPGYTSYLWSNNQTDTSIFVNSSGQYWAQIITGNGCAFRDTVSLNFVICSGVRPNNVENSIFEIFPNPSTGEFNVRIDSKRNEELTIRILDIHGRLLLNQNLQTYGDNNLESIQMTDAIPGLYFLEIGNGIWKSSAKLIVE